MKTYLPVGLAAAAPVVTAALLTASIAAAQTAAPPQATPVPVVNVVVSKDGTITWNGTLIRSDKDLQDHIAAAAAQPNQPEVHINPAVLCSSSFKSISHFLEAAQRGGLKKIGMVGNGQFLPE